MRRAILVTLAAGALTALLAAQAAAAPSVRKGGTLKAMFSTDVDFIDPSLAYYAHSWGIMGATGANLLRFADAEGSAGSRIVPEVAAAFPRVSPERTHVHVHAPAGLPLLEREGRDGPALRLGDRPRPEQPAAVAGGAVRR